MDKICVNIIILNWNNSEDTIACLKSIQYLRDVRYRIILVDNGSNKGEYNTVLQWVNHNFENIQVIEKVSDKEQFNNVKGSEEQGRESITIIRNLENYGFAKGNNIGIRYCLKFWKNDYVLLLNNDTEVEPDSIGKLVNFLEEHPNYQAATPQIRYYKPNDVIWNCGGNINWYKRRVYDYAETKISEVPQEGNKEITFITGCALLFKPVGCGLLSEKFFFGEEDFEFSLRMKKQQKKMACLYSSVIYHKVGRSIEKSSGMKGRVVLFYLNRLINLRNYVNPLFWMVLYTVSLLYAFVLLTVKYRCGIYSSLQAIKSIAIGAVKMNGVNKDMFLKAKAL